MKALTIELKDKKSLSKIRLEYAKEALRDAEFLMNNDSYKASANRSYYAIFYAMRAVLAFDELDKKKHSGVISNFRKLYIKTKIFSDEMSDMITKLFKIRTDSDYKDFYIISKREVTQQIKGAKSFIREVEKFLTTKYK